MLGRVQTASPCGKAADDGAEAGHEGTAESAALPAAARRCAAQLCGWCGGPIEVKARGRIPSWCSPACRQRAWEQSRAAASGLAAVRIVERAVQVDAELLPPKHAEWVALLAELTHQLDSGAVYERDLPALSDALQAVLAARDRRSRARGT